MGLFLRVFGLQHVVGRFTSVLFALAGLLPYLTHLTYQDLGSGFAHFWAHISHRAAPRESDFLPLISFLVVRVVIEEYVGRYAHVVAELEDTGYGPLKVWKVDVDAIPLMPD